MCSDEQGTALAPWAGRVVHTCLTATSHCARALPSLVPSIAALWASPGSSLSLPRAVQEEEVKEEAALGFLDVSGCHPEELQLINRTQACGVLADPEGPFAVCHQTVAPEPFLE